MEIPIEKSKMENHIRLAISRTLFLCLVFMLGGCAKTDLFDDSYRMATGYRGKVIDSTTREPIEGAVVLGVWNREYPNPGGIYYEFFDTRETLTDADGEFIIKKMDLRVQPILGEVGVVVFKVGYQNLGPTNWSALKTQKYYKRFVQWEGDKAIIPLDKWNLEQRRKRLGGRVVGVPDEKQTLLLEAIREEDYEIR